VKSAARAQPGGVSFFNAAEVSVVFVKTGVADALDSFIADEFDFRR
jgi:hypothetical protein